MKDLKRKEEEHKTRDEKILSNGKRFQSFMKSDLDLYPKIQLGFESLQEANGETPYYISNKSSSRNDCRGGTGFCCYCVMDNGWTPL